MEFNQVKLNNISNTDCAYKRRNQGPLTFSWGVNTFVWEEDVAEKGESGSHALQKEEAPETVKALRH